MSTLAADAKGRRSTYPEVAAGGVDLVDVGVVHLVGRTNPDPEPSSRRAPPPTRSEVERAMDRRALTD